MSEKINELTTRKKLDITIERLKQGRLSSVFSGLTYDTLLSIKKELEVGINASKKQAIEDKKQTIINLQKELDDLQK